VLAYGPQNSREQLSTLDRILEKNPVWFGEKSGMKCGLEKNPVHLEKNPVFFEEKTGINTKSLRAPNTTIVAPPSLLLPKNSLRRLPAHSRALMRCCPRRTELAEDDENVSAGLLCWVYTTIQQYNSCYQNESLDFDPLYYWAGPTAPKVGKILESE
jgi:hypothetical protein